MTHPSKNGFLWHFTDDRGGFLAEPTEWPNSLYFPLASEAGLLSSITPSLHGDIKTGQDSFLTLPVSTEDLHNLKSSRNFWVFVEGRGTRHPNGGGQAWSLTGVSATQEASKKRERVTLEAGLLWHKVTRENPELGFKSEITNFVPVTGETVELMIVSFTNTGKATLKITPTSGIPIFARSADNLRDHHHVTSLLNRLVPHPMGVVVKPTMSFDERGHRINDAFYAVLGAGSAGERPAGFFPTVGDFIGEGGTFETPTAVLSNLGPPQKDPASFHGKPVMGALRFNTLSVPSHGKASFVLILGVTRKEKELDEWIKKFGTLSKAEAALKENKTHWAAKADKVRFKTQDKTYNAWLRWVSLQPTLRKLFGCSFLPDFDYGRGGRGWRDLWQDGLALLFTSSTEEAKKLLLNNFNGVRIDGSNATIIGSESNEFIADRNNITRVWMDHGVWPYLTLELYIHQSGDFGVLFEKARYFRDTQQSRARKKDLSWNESYGKNLKDKKGRLVEGTVLEHLLVQHLVQFYNVGEHNHIRLENADWNDGLDMAYARGESVAFTSLYAANFKKLADLLEEASKNLGLKKVSLAKELLLLLDRASGEKIRYDSVEAKRKTLERYFASVEPVVSGRKIELRIALLLQDLRDKAVFLTEHVRKKEWSQTRAGEGFFNGYYDNHGRRVEGDSSFGMRLTLAGQVFPIMAGVATQEQVGEIFKTVKKYLKDKEHGGFRLNTDFGEIRPDLGRAFSFVYGDKENGAFFSHMAVLLAYALYQRGFAQEGHEVLDSIFRMCLRTEKSKIYPGIPEYFNSEGQGLYHYLTGSASWYLLTVLTQVFGIRGRWGDLVLAPKLVQSDFSQTPEVSADTHFADRRIRVVYRNPKKIPYEHYCVAKVTLNGKELKNLEFNKKEAVISRQTLLKNLKKSDNLIVVTLE